MAKVLIVTGDADPSEYVALVIPGGRAPEYIRNDEDCQRIVQHFNGESKPVAQLCHGPASGIPARCKGSRTLSTLRRTLDQVPVIVRPVTPRVARQSPRAVAPTRRFQRAFG